MKYIKLGNTDLVVSRLGFGLMRLEIPRENPSFENSIKLIRGAIERGINFFDIGTFYCHGFCEEVFGRSVSGAYKARTILSGKNSSHQDVRINWRDSLDNTLRLFNVDTLDIYFLHYLNLNTWEKFYVKDSNVEQIHQARKEGLFKYLGFSSHDSPEHVKTLIDTQIFDVVILPYNFLETKYEKLLEYANLKGLGLIVMNPLAGGILTKIRMQNSEGGVKNADIKKLALKYVFNNPNIHCVLSGMNSVSEMEENIRILEDSTIKNETIIRAQSNLEDLQKENQIYCTACNYCLPCTQGISIPAVIDIYNKYNNLNAGRIYSREYSLLEINADCCVECGICESRCPNEINIMEIMKESIKRYYG